MNEATDLNFHELFGPVESNVCWTPNQGQTSLTNLVGEIDKPFILILESPTGTGKTEAFLYTYAIRSRKNLLGTDGLFVGLPSMATTNAMFLRVKDFLHRLHTDKKTSLHLAQSESFMNENFQELLAKGVSGEDTDYIKAYDWFNGRKRSLLAQNAVGTVDQIMLSSMLTRHQFVRMLGLYGKTVVIDEIHAYDSYMMSIICDLLSWLRAIKSPVILLSATLPRQMKYDLLYAYSRDENVDSVQLIRGPNISLWTEDYIESIPIMEIQQRELEISLIETQGTDESVIQEAANQILKGVRLNGCIGCIMNIVADAQEVAKIVKERIDSSIPVLVAHSRFTREDRSQWEKSILDLLGPESDQRPEKLIVIGTQVLEQSLDIDFDLLISDIAPIDLLIQRAGRVHRHKRHRESHRKPKLITLIPEIDRFCFRHSIQAIYKASVLTRTVFALLEQGNILTIPGDDEPLISAVYEETQTVPDAVSEKLIDWDKDAYGEQYSSRTKADRISLGPFDNYMYDPPLIQLADKFLEVEDEQISTRLGNNSIQVIIVDETITVDSPPTLLINKAIRISNSVIIKILKQQDIPENWKNNWFLSRSVPIHMTNSHAQVDSITFSYDSSMGLRIKTPIQGGSSHGVI